MTPTFLTLTLALLLPGEPATGKDTPRKPNPLAPSLPELTEEEEEKLDQVIDRFIEHDIGNLTGEEGRRARKAFDKLGPEAIPALIRGLNKAAGIDHSCPAVVIGKKLSRLLGGTNDLELLEYARENIGAGVERSRHMVVLKDLRVLCMFRKADVNRRGAAFVAAKEKTGGTLTVTQLAEAAGKERGAKLKEVLTELGKRRGHDALAALGTAAASYEGETRELARELLYKQLSGLSAAAVKEKLKDDKPEIRATAAKLVGEKRWPLGGELIALLEDDSATVREAAHKGLVRLSDGSDFGPEANAKKDERAEAVQKWRAWWARQGNR